MFLSTGVKTFGGSVLRATVVRRSGQGVALPISLLTRAQGQCRAFGGHNPHGDDPLTQAKAEYELHPDHHKTPKPSEHDVHFKTVSTSEPKTPQIQIPEYDLAFSATTTGGPGGQNANKVATAVELRFDLESAWWIPDDVKDRLREQQPNRINKNGEFYVTSSVGRTQHGNRKDAMSKLQQIIDQAAEEPKVHIPWATVSKEGLEHRKLFKQARKNIKSKRAPIKY
jgi:hypothetical protein